jgi:glucose-6-phosphate isomerase
VNDVTTLAAWQVLEAHRHETTFLLKSLFAGDKDRFNKFSHHLPGMLVDLSKNLITEKTKGLLLALAEESGLVQARQDLFGGEKINSTEKRAVLHTALRAAADTAISNDGRNVVPDVHATLKNMGRFAEAVRSGKWRGHSGKEITDIVNIGIGGSYLGPQLATEALSGFHHSRLTCHYVSNVEASDLGRVLKKVSPETTLFIIASKTFTTAETMLNARIARDWIINHYKEDRHAVGAHFAAASTNTAAVKDFGIAAENMFPFEDWVGGRYSVWSAIGLSTMIMIGEENFHGLLNGARAMDDHFKNAPLDQNVPVLMAMIGIWYRNFMNYPAYAVIPYNSLLRRLPAYLQQLDMESNGKSVTRKGLPVTAKTGPLVFGEPGTDAQHSFFQWLHQGTDVVPADFIAALKTTYDTPEQRNMLLANFLAQTEALMNGREDNVETHRHYPGNRPTTTILLDVIDPHSIGMLLALYEHKIFVQGIVWSINSFDQWGVELGKILAKPLEDEILKNKPANHDASTLGLLDYIVKHSV